MRKVIQAKLFDVDGNPIRGLHGELQDVREVVFDTQYPEGLYGDASFFVRRNTSLYWHAERAYRCELHASGALVHEGRVTNFRHSKRGTTVYISGFFKEIFGAKRIDKAWAEKRLTDSVWKVTPAIAGHDLAHLKRDGNRLRIVPKAEQWGAGQYFEIVATAPGGDLWKRVSLDYDFAEQAGQQWQFRLVANGANIWSIVASGNGSRDDTLGANEDDEVKIQLRNSSGGNQTPNADGSTFGQVLDVTLYTETGSINMEEIFKDLIAEVSSEVSSDTDFIDAAASALDLTPYVTNGLKYLSEIIQEVVGMGDGDGNAWGYGLRASVESTDGLPVPFLQQQPTLTASEYEYEIDFANVPNFSYDWDIDRVRNHISVEYRDESGNQQRITPDDDATLKDTDSIAQYGERQHGFTLPGTSSTEIATAAGQRVLAALKDAQRVFPSFNIARHIKRRGSSRIGTPVIRVEAGERVRCKFFADNFDDDSDVYLISATSYNGETDTLTLTLQKESSLESWFAGLDYRREPLRFLDPPFDPQPFVPPPPEDDPGEFVLPPL